MANCSCCSRDVSVPSEKKGRRHLSSPTLVSKLKILLELVKEKMPASGPALNVERYVEGFKVFEEPHTMPADITGEN